MDKSDILWKKFEESGRVEDYLAFKQVKEEEQNDLHDAGSDNTGAVHG
ncbi:MAG: hypothetical protein ACI4QV_03210 [Acutalibacteraceae bacterium]